MSVYSFQRFPGITFWQNFRMNVYSNVEACYFWQSSLTALISEHIRFSDFYPLIRAVEKFHARHFYFRQTLLFNLQLLSEKPFWHYFWLFLTAPFVCFEQKTYPPYYFYEENLDPPRLFQPSHLFRTRENSNVMFPKTFFKLECNVCTCYCYSSNSHFC